jgi:hypothetical protein
VRRGQGIIGSTGLMETAINSTQGRVRGMVSFRQWSSQFSEKVRQNLVLFETCGWINIDVLNKKKRHYYMYFKNPRNGTVNSEIK